MTIRLHTVKIAGFRVRLLGRLWLPWIQYRGASRFEVCRIPGYDRHSVKKRCRSDQSISNGMRIRHMKFGAAQRYRSIYRQDTICKGGKHIAIEPCP